MTRGERVAAAALAMVGTRFRLHGRDADGLDCVGLVAVALRGGGYRGAVPTGYALRCGAVAQAAEVARVAGLEPVHDAAPGDILLMRPAAGQLHLGVGTREGLVHADAGARRVVARPGASPWPVLARWRLVGE